MQAYALLPDGQKKWLLWIKNWDFKWQGDYGYAQPVELPAGSRLVLHYTYDNSTNNPRNPNNPPKRVIYGLQSADEMGELYFQALTRDRNDYVTLARDYSRKLLNDSLAFFRFRIDLDTKDADAHARLGRLYAGTGQTEPAVGELNRALQLNPNNASAHFDMGSLLLREKKFVEAAEEFKAAARLDPDDAQSVGSLGIISLQLRQPEEARNYFRQALAIDAEDSLAAKYLHLLEGGRPAQKER
jgi:tetratricopeptide (TPR) repeat protein